MRLNLAALDNEELTALEAGLSELPVLSMEAERLSSKIQEQKLLRTAGLRRRLQ